jgi:hypothetical protein
VAPWEACERGRWRSTTGKRGVEVDERSLVARTKILCGVVAGPVFVSVFTLLGARRARYDWRRHAVSSLAAGGGWTQRATSWVSAACTASRDVVLGRAPREPSARVGPDADFCRRGRVDWLWDLRHRSRGWLSGTRACSGRPGRRRGGGPARSGWTTAQLVRHPNLCRSADGRAVHRGFGRPPA